MAAQLRIGKIFVDIAKYGVTARRTSATLFQNVTGLTLGAERKRDQIDNLLIIEGSRPAAFTQVNTVAAPRYPNSSRRATGSLSSLVPAYRSIWGSRPTIFGAECRDSRTGCDHDMNSADTPAVANDGFASPQRLLVAALGLIGPAFEAQHDAQRIVAVAQLLRLADIVARRRGDETDADAAGTLQLDPRAEIFAVISRQDIERRVAPDHFLAIGRKTITLGKCVGIEG